MKCSFCNTDITKGMGFLYSYKDGTIEAYCSRKCEVNSMHMKRKPQKTKWTGRYHEEKDIRVHGKDNRQAKEQAPKAEAAKKKASRAERKAKRETKKSDVKKKKDEIKQMKASGQKKEAAPAEAKAE